MVGGATAGCNNTMTVVVGCLSCVSLGVAGDVFGKGGTPLKNTMGLSRLGVGVRGSLFRSGVTSRCNNTIGVGTAGIGIVGSRFGEGVTGVSNNTLFVANGSAMIGGSGFASGRTVPSTDGLGSKLKKTVCMGDAGILTRGGRFGLGATEGNDTVCFSDRNIRFGLMGGALCRGRT